MTQVLAIAAGGALGSVLRYGVSYAVHGLFGRGFPYGTLAVNVLGCVAMGYLWVLFLERPGAGAVARAGVLVGLLGGFTTFSAFSIETLNLLREGAWQRAALYVLLSIALCLAGTCIGVLVARYA
ncbi:MAG TPA: fluoride efflux transporter CrcB [Burkholderiales bacterium]